MKTVRDLLAILLANGYTLSTLASELGTSAASVRRWEAGASTPRPQIEAELRRKSAIVSGRATHAMQTGLNLSEEFSNATLTRAVDEILQQIREAMHRRSRFSSRNEALDEVTKLLFSHFVSVFNHRLGIGKEGLSSRRGQNAAVALRLYVHDAFEAYLPESLSTEVNKKDYELRLRPQETALANDLISSFDQLHRVSAELINSATGLDVLNDVFGKFLAGSFADEKQLGQYLTPTEVVHFMVTLCVSDLAPDELETLTSPDHADEFGTIMDPSCGVGSFLAMFMHLLQPIVRARHGDEALTIWRNRMMRSVLVGIDKSERMIRLALTNLAIFGLPAANLHLANALSRKGDDGKTCEAFEGKCGIILTNPPFGAEFQRQDLAGYKLVSTPKGGSRQSVNSELLFLERYLDWLKPGGACLAIVPDSILTNKGIFSNLRHQLASSAEIRAVISLPPATFGAAGTTTKTSILYLRKHRNGHETRRTFAAVCNDVGYEIVKRGTHAKKIPTGQSDFSEIVRSFGAAGSQHSVGSWVENVARLPRWDAPSNLSPTGDRSPNGATSHLPRVSDVADLIEDRVQPRRWGQAYFDYIEISDVDAFTCIIRPGKLQASNAPSRARQRVKAGDVLISTVRPERRVVGVVRKDQDGAVCTTGFAVLRPKVVHPFTLAYMLKTDFVTQQLTRATSGIAYPAVEKQTIVDVTLPIRSGSLNSFNDLARQLESSHEALTAALSAFLMVVGEETKTSGPTSR